MLVKVDPIAIAAEVGDLRKRRARLRQSLDSLWVDAAGRRVIRQEEVHLNRVLQIKEDILAELVQPEEDDVMSRLDVRIDLRIAALCERERLATLGQIVTVEQALERVITTSRVIPNAQALDEEAIICAEMKES